VVGLAGVGIVLCTQFQAMFVGLYLVWGLEVDASMVCLVV
jgi:hypothetical protein